jgi:two-component system, OmpR family, phosphate regulon response regulator PhoB
MKDMSPNILIIEDDAAIAELVRYNLAAEGYRVALAATGEDAEVMVDEDRFDLVVLDWMLPGLSGIELCRRLRRRASTAAVPILMLTARGEEADRVRGLATGADDYVVKPFSVPEMTARVKALLRRAAPQRVADTLQSGDIVLDRSAHRVMRRSREVHLGPTEFRLLAFFMENSGRVLSRQQLLDGVWGRDVFIDGRTVDVHVGRLRKALMRGTETDPIRTIRGAGYVLEEVSSRKVLASADKAGGD